MVILSTDCCICLLLLIYVLTEVHATNIRFKPIVLMLALLLIHLLNFWLLLFVPFVSSTYTLFSTACDFANKIRNVFSENYHMLTANFDLYLKNTQMMTRLINCLATKTCKLITLITIVFLPEFFPNNSIYFEHTDSSTF